MKEAETIILRKNVRAIPTSLYKGDEIQLQRVYQNKKGKVYMVFKMVAAEDGSKILLQREFAVELSELA